MNPGITFGLMLIGLLLYAGGIFALFYYTYSLAKGKIGSSTIIGYIYEENKNPKSYYRILALYLVTGVIFLFLSIGLLVFSLYMIVGLIGSLVILFLLLFVTIFLTVNIRKKYKKFLESKNRV